MSAVSWQSARLRAPPPITLIESNRRPVHSCQTLQHEVVLARQRGEDRSDELARILRSRARRRPHTGVRSETACRRGAGDLGGRGQTADRLARSCSRAARARRNRSSDAVHVIQWRRHSCISHRPMTFRSKRIEPSIPRSLVKLNAAAAPSSTGASTSTPSSDQVPEDRITEFGEPTGAAMKADAVSWAATFQTGKPASASIPEQHTARAECPARPGRPGRSASESQAPPQGRAPSSPVRASSMPGGRGDRRLIGERRRSATSRAGRGSARCARRPQAAGASRSASNWKSVLIGIVWMPVRA